MAKKAKTRKSLSKRLRRTRKGKGKLVRRKTLSQHRVTGKSKRARKLSGRTLILSKTNRKIARVAGV